MPVAIAATNQLAADAGAVIAEAGGNAVDCAIAAAFVAMVTEPGIVSLAGGAFLTIEPPDGPAETIDGYVTMPGRGVDAGRVGTATFDISTDYGGGVDITIGYGTIATPGCPAGLAMAHRRHGRAPWRELLEPAIDVARDGFALGSAASYYLGYVHEDLYGWHPTSRAALHDVDGALVPEGGTVVVDDLADSLTELADEGADAFYTGSLARRIVADVQAHGGLLTAADLAAYQPVVRAPITTRVDGWDVATNPPPAVGGVTLAGMLEVLAPGLGPVWGVDDYRRLVEAQHLVLGHRVTTLDLAEDREAAARHLLDLAAGRFHTAMQSPSTIHVSATDTDGRSCAITSSAGYGSGVIAPGTGIWLNNSLGEQELNRRGVEVYAVGERLPSNMAPTVARHADGRSLAIGSPGADRITTAVLQTLLRFFGGRDLADAVAAPRVHVRHGEDGTVREVGHEPGVSLPDDMPGPAREYHRLAMFFGGVAATLRSGDGHLEAAADPRRVGATAVAG